MWTLQRFTLMPLKTIVMCMYTMPHCELGTKRKNAWLGLLSAAPIMFPHLHTLHLCLPKEMIFFGLADTLARRAQHGYSLPQLIVQYQEQDTSGDALGWQSVQAHVGSLELRLIEDKLRPELPELCEASLDKYWPQW